MLTLALVVALLQQTTAFPPTGNLKPQAYGREEQSSEFWLKKADESLLRKLKTPLNYRTAKNVILFLGDGMSITTVTSARIYSGQLHGKAGEEAVFSFEKFPYTGLSKTYCVNSQVADSACSATAYLTGVKAQRGVLGLNAQVANGDCLASTNNATHTKSILHWAQEAGKSTGIVTNTRVTHATPAGAYSHTPNRHWESDSDVLRDKQDPRICRDIAYQMINHEPGRSTNVIMGGGKDNFFSKKDKAIYGPGGRRKDGLDLISTWKNLRSKEGVVGKYVSTRSQLLGLDYNKTDYLLGLFTGSHMSYWGEADKQKEPTLPEMVEASIKILQRNPKGYFLFVEGGRIDTAHHLNKAKTALEETIQFAKAVDRAVSMAGSEDTLILVTSDHAHTLTLSGYADRGHNILSVAGVSNVDKLPYTILSYANGPGYKKQDGGKRHNVLDDDMSHRSYEFPATIPLKRETHGGEDVGIYAIGPWSHLFSGVNEQTFIPVAAMFASCFGPESSHCSNSSIPRQ